MAERPEPGVALREALADRGDRPGDEAPLCDFCRMPIPGPPIVDTIADREYVFCTNACRNELVETESVFSEYHGYRRIPTGVDGLDRFLPQGVPRNSFVLISGEPGTRKNDIGTELIWRTLERGEPAAHVAFTEPPLSIVQRFLDMGWNILPALEEDRLRIVDCFTSRVDHADRVHRRLSRWSRYLSSVVAPQTAGVNDPSDPAEVRNKIENVTEDLSLIDRGLVHIDSLTEFGTLVQPIQAYNFVKDIRADVAKGRFVPVFGGATVTTDLDAFPHDLSYVLDGIIDLQLDGETVKDTLIRRVRVRKMNGVLAITEWTAFEYTSGTGMVPFDPLAEIEKHGGTAPQPDEHS